MKVVVITLAATFFIQIGYFLWKLSADSLPRIGQASISTLVLGFVSSWQWLAGLGATIAGWLLFIVATDLGDVSLVQPLMSIGDLFLILLAVVFLHERLTKVEVLGLGLTVIGAVCIASEADIVKPATINWHWISVFFVLATGSLLFFAMRAKKTSRPEIMLAVAVGIGFGAGAVLTKLLTAYVALNGQDLSLMIILFNPVFPFMVAANIAGLALLQVAFQRGRAAVVVPVQLAVVNLLAVIAGGGIFLESISLLRLAGVVLIVAGTVFLRKSEDVLSRN